MSWRHKSSKDDGGATYASPLRVQNLYTRDTPFANVSTRFISRLFAALAMRGFLRVGFRLSFVHLPLLVLGDGSWCRVSTSGTANHEAGRQDPNRYREKSHSRFPSTLRSH